MDRTFSSDDAPRVVTSSRSKGPGKALFERIFAKGLRVNGRYARISSLPGTGCVGFATSRKLGGKPQRARQRRRFKAALSACVGLRSESLDYVVILGPLCADATFERITEEARDLMTRANARWVDGSESS